ncbi:MAG: plasmid mobilization relaxosome protein MobC [Calditrichaeota bacterium]|nr:MAG: plasmid mobilization relaxosome protein MobC [Calditrichota bacterium]
MVKVSAKLLVDKRHLVKGIIPLKSLSTFDSNSIEICNFGEEEEILSGNKIHRKEYQKDYHKNYWSKKTRFQLTFSNSENLRIQKSAKRHKLKTGKFLKKCVFAYLDKILIPSNESKMQSIELAIRKVGNNVNQIARNSNKLKTLGVFNAKKVSVLLNSLEIEIRRNLSLPIDLLKVIQNKLESSPEFLNKLEWIIYHHKLKKFNDCQNQKMEKYKLQKID